jgi:hypothetical protein
MPSRIVLSASLATALGLGFAAPASAEIVVAVDKVTQRMTVTVDGEQRYTWPVSTGRPGFDTPSGTFHANRMDATHKSQEYDNAPMPHTVFFDWHGHALHGFLNTSQIGNPASHGCVRMQPEKAALLYTLIAMTGLKNTTVIIAGKTPSLSDLLKERRHSLVEAKAELPVQVSAPHNGELSLLTSSKEPADYVLEAALYQELSSDYDKLLPPPPFRPFGTRPPTFRLPPVVSPDAEKPAVVASAEEPAAVPPQPFRPFGTKPPAYLEPAANAEPEKQRLASVQPPTAKAQPTAMVQLTDEAELGTAMVQPAKVSVQPQQQAKASANYGRLEYNRQAGVNQAGVNQARANYGRPVYYYVVPAYPQPQYYVLVPRDTF